MKTSILDISIDGHVHTKLCHHARGEMEEYVQAAINKGLSKLIFLEHLEVDINYFESTWLSEDDFNFYHQEGMRLKEIYRDRIEIGLGIEIGYNPNSLEEIQRLNPAFIRQTIHRDGPHTLVLPKAHAASFRARLANLTETQRVQWVRHRIRSGDTLGNIARQYRITVTRLREFNHLPDSHIIAGDLLIVPVARG